MSQSEVARVRKAMAQVRALARATTDDKAIAQLVSKQHGLLVTSGNVAEERELMARAGALRPDRAPEPAPEPEPEPEAAAEPVVIDGWSERELRFSAESQERYRLRMERASRALVTAMAREALRCGLLLPHMTVEHMRALASQHLSE